ncbi:putative 1-aminocyclopropane-1-carboxylate oxidase [Exophiala viscosa]|uniref:1-aminocyclopropane-1-carboxylate oxidase n=1 Tax=Exophiala viscosa TaxID=2486360 RepID=A0AAN6ID58_9EURO|nr:putative 1-aminocyclopropane-1-carboxylate oxidase [Exophiala viscosa]
MYKKGGNFGLGEVSGDLSIVGDFTTIPVIDVAGVYSENIRDRKAVAEKIRDACTRVGFFYIEGHGIPQELIDNVFSLGKQFFALTFEEKMKVFVNNRPNYRGYTPLFGSGNPNKEGLGNANEAFDWGHDPKLNDDPNDAFVDPFMKGENVWPTESLPEFEECLSEYYRRLRSFSRVLARNVALSLDLAEDFFDEDLAHPGCSAVIAHYPPQAPKSEQFGLDPHSDSEFFTVLAPGEVRALEVLNKRREWVSAPPRHGSFIVNIGDQLQSWTNGLYISTMHRVSNLSRLERYSVPFFFSANYECVIKPIPKFVLKGTKIEYEEITAGEMYKNTMIKFHRIATTHPVYSKYVIDGIHDLAQHESQKHLRYT